jgi:hypothetical protein
VGAGESWGKVFLFAFEKNCSLNIPNTTHIEPSNKHKLLETMARNQTPPAEYVFCSVTRVTG